ncbi:MAG: MaoC family dehydratase, partial [Chloroflexi bacterium]|nr:MaoC family dehydratase [Chloroflexota bacterium]
MTTTSPNNLRMPADEGRYTIAKSFEVTARSITAFAGGVDDFNPVYFEDDRPGGLIAHPGMVFSWQWNSRFTPDVEYPLELVRRGVHAWVDVQFDPHAREGDVITSQGQSDADNQIKPGELSAP